MTPTVPEENPQQQAEADLLEERINDALLSLLVEVEREDEYLRLQQLRQFKKNNLFWHGFQYLFWSDTDNDWRVPTHEQFEELSSREETHFLFDYVINIFKAHGESIIAALSNDIPDVRFGPVNAEDPDDHRAVVAASNCVELIEKWNRAKSLIINAIFHLITEGFVASYTYNKKDSEYGDIKVPEYGKEARPVCPQCSSTAEAPVHQPGVFEAENPDAQTCPQCGSPMDSEEVPVLIGERLIPKGREIIEVYGPLNVRMPAYVSKQGDAGWLLHYVDADPALFQEAFPKIAEDIVSDVGESYGRIMRQSSLVMQGFQLNTKLVTQKRLWLRPWMLNRLTPEFDDIIPMMREQYPNGIYFSSIDKKVCEKRSESLDKHWSVTKAGPSKGLHADPTLQSLIPVSEIKNNLTNLFVMQVEYGVPASYADSEVFDFDGQSKQEVSPGYIYPIKLRPNQSASEAFFTEKTTMLSKESTQLAGMIDSDGQFVVGSYPSIYGGPAQSGSKTLGEYEKSRSFALQRLALLWYFINVWWCETLHKSVLSFIDHQVDDESITVQNGPAQFQTKWVKKADFKGSFDRLEPEASADFPVSISQKRQLINTLLQLNNEEINKILALPENAGIVKSYLGLDDLKMPDDIQRQKQMREILILIGFEPQQTAGGVQSTVPVEPDIDIHPIHIEVLTVFLCGDTGQDLKEYNPQGYANCLAHLIEHKQAEAQQQMPQQAQPQVTAPPQGEPPNAGPVN